MAGWSPPADVDALRSALVAWFDANRRPFPWRSATDPWRVLVLEVMSQQTQLDRVTEAWEAFVRRWPTPDALADAARGDVIAFWSDHRLGYNRRAAHLHAAAGEIVTTFDGALPRDPDELETLPGVGPYTANAVASFAFDTGGPVIDTNVRRVLHRAFGVPDDERAYAEAADALAPGDDVGRWNGAIMELGGVACGTRPRCDEAGCPLRRWCEAYRTGDFTAPDVPTQPSYEGSRRQARGRVLRALRRRAPQTIPELGGHVREGFDPASDRDRAWLRELVGEMEEEGLVAVEDGRIRLPA